MQPMNPIISLGQISISLGNTDINFQKSVEYIISAKSAGSDLILFPELWTSGYVLSQRDKIAKINTEFLAKLQSIANELDIWIGGSYLLKDNENFYNTFQLIEPRNSSSTYRKVHLFRLMKEDQWLSPGSSQTIAQTPWGPSGLSICYDLRFPELFRNYALAGCNWIMICAEWPLIRIDHWLTLIKARAIENQCFVIAVNTVGEFGKEVFGGSSTIISPWGETLAIGSNQNEELITTPISMDMVPEIRKKIPIFSDRRPDVYLHPFKKE